MVNIPRHDLPRNALLSEGITPLDKGHQQGQHYQYFMLPDTYIKERVEQALRFYLAEEFEATTIRLWHGRRTGEIKATWKDAESWRK